MTCGVQTTVRLLGHDTHPRHDSGAPEAEAPAHRPRAGGERDRGGSSGVPPRTNPGCSDPLSGLTSQGAHDGEGQRDHCREGESKRQEKAFPTYNQIQGTSENISK